MISGYICMVHEVSNKTDCNLVYQRHPCPGIGATDWQESEKTSNILHKRDLQDCASIQLEQ